MNVTLAPTHVVSNRGQLQSPRFVATVLCLLVVSLLWGCRGPNERSKKVRLKVDVALVTQDWRPGPRLDAALAKIRRQGRLFARSLFTSSPMPSGMPEELNDAPREMVAAIAERASEGVEQPPNWWKGAAPQPESYKHDLPKEYLIEVQRGETFASLARWSKTEVARIKTINRDRLKRNRWLRPGMELKMVMSPHQKMAFDQARERFQKKRLEDYFSERYIERVVSYRVKRGDVISRVAAKYGETPIWLLEEFNQTDFRSLQPGDIILIPTVKRMRGGRRAPPRLQVVDMHGNQLTAEKRSKLGDRLRPDLVGVARLAMDDSNVFERDPRHLQRTTNRGLLPSAAAPVSAHTGYRAAPTGVVPQASPSQAIAYPQHVPAQQQPAMLPASIRSVQPAVNAATNTTSKPAAPPTPAVRVREVIVKPGETLSHYGVWAGLSIKQILKANPKLEPEQIYAGRRLKLPLTDEAYADFVMARAGVPRHEREAAAEATAAQATAASAPKAPPAPTYKEHVVSSGETGSAIAKHHKITLGQLKKANPKRNLDLLFVGERLRIPVQ